VFSNSILIKSIQAFFVRGLGAGVALLVTLVISHLLPPSEAGFILFTIGVVASLGQIMTFGTPDAIMKFVAGYIDSSWVKVNKVYSGLLKWVTLFCVCIFVLGVIFNREIVLLLFDDLTLSTFVLVLPIGVLGMAVILMTSAAILGLHRTLLASFLQSCLLPMLFMAFCFLLSYTASDFNKLDVAFIYILSVSIVSLITVFIWFHNKEAKFLVCAPISSDVKRSVKPLFIAMLMQVCILYAGQYAAALFLPASDIAFYIAAQRVAMSVSLVLNAINLVVAPKFSHATFSHNPEKLNALALQTSKLMLYLAGPIVLLIIVYSEWILNLFGKEYVVASNILVIMAIGQFVNVATGSVGYLLTMTNHEKDYRNVIIISGTLTLFMSLLLTKTMGLLGAAIATAVGLSIQNLLAAYFVKARLGFNTLNIFRKVKQT